MKSIEQIGQQAKAASRVLNSLDTLTKNRILNDAAQALIQHTDEILEANELDMINARDSGMKQSLQDRLKLTPARIESMAQGMLEVMESADPIGEVSNMKKRPNGLMIGQMRVPLGVVAVIYEARPNVTSDVFSLCFKAGNAAILKCGKDAINSCLAIAKVLNHVLEEHGMPQGVLQLLEDTSHEASEQLMRCNQYVDVLIPRGGAGLIRFVVDHATVPVIETGTGNCHVYVDEDADLKMAVDIIINGKTQRTGVCNAVESILIHKNIAEKILPVLENALVQHAVEMRADEVLYDLLNSSYKVRASEEDWKTEYLDLIVSMKSVDSLEEAIEHINRYNTGHSETIVTNDYNHARKFLTQVDAAAVYVNASTRFTDGGQFGLGAEIGISTQKLHARGPMGLQALTTTKYVILGSGQIRE